ncbi:DNA-processing protein DprA [Arthrobacter sp. JSM 101049]|uniref:DNA-processing protein DprA n=1 Tax=Arthrobacter sp. JSM 101049 TaxID=929097 RepID=UPI003569B7D2
MSTDPGILLARAGLARLMEPNDLTGTALVAVAGPVEAYRLITASTGTAPATEQQAVADLLGGDAGKRGAHRLDAGLERWRPRMDPAGPQRDLATIRRFGGDLLVPEDDAWPLQLNDLGLSAPLCLWWRGTAGPGHLPGPEALLAVVGSRDATDYGRHVTYELVADLVPRGITIVSGGAYGIDARAHEAALQANRAGHPADRPATIAVMAGGLDRFYPAGNDELLRRVESTGLLLAEVPPGTAPTRWRFLQRNRLLAALCGATLVVEARWRSGALTTARRASEIGRDVGAVPGSVLSSNSAGCHRLLREGSAVAVTDAAEALELLGITGDADPAMTWSPHGGDADARAHDGLDIQDLLLMDALPLRQAAAPDKLAMVSGLGIGAVLGGLSRLEARGLAEQSPNGWRRRRPT